MAVYFFASTEALRATLQLCDDAESWRRETRRYELLGDDGERAWLLDVAGTVAGIPHDDQTVRVEDDAVTVESGETTTRYRRGEVTEAPSLLQAVPLVPRARDPRAPVTWLGIDSGPRFVEVVRANLMLGNDRMTYLALGDDKALLRVERLSAFLLEKLRADGVRTYYPSEEEPRFLLPGGLAHPLAEKLRLLPGGDDRLWLLDEDGTWRSIRGRTRDVYEQIAVDAALLHVEELQPEGVVPTITVALTLEPTERRGRTQLWRLTAAERPVLEELLREADEAELNNLQIAVVRDTRGAVGYVIVERHGLGSALAPPLHGGRAYVPLLPEELLFLPAGHSLQPVLSRATLIDVLGLAEDRLTIVDRDEAGLRITRVPTSALLPIMTVVDYFAVEAAEDVTGLLDTVRFDFDIDTEPAEAAEAGWWTRFLRFLGLVNPAD